MRVSEKSRGRYSVTGYNGLYAVLNWRVIPDLRLVTVRLMPTPPLPEPTESPPSAIRFLISQAEAMLHGEDIVPEPYLFDLSELSPFARRVLCEIRRIAPAGRVVSYGELAKFATYPGAARAVGSVMRRNPFPLFYPCHRVVKANGDPGLFQGGAEGKWAKLELLRREGVMLSNGAVNRADFGEACN